MSIWVHGCCGASYLPRNDALRRSPLCLSDNGASKLLENLSLGVFSECLSHNLTIFNVFFDNRAILVSDKASWVDEVESLNVYCSIRTKAYLTLVVPRTGEDSHSLVERLHVHDLYKELTCFGFWDRPDLNYVKPVFLTLVH